MKTIGKKFEFKSAASTSKYNWDAILDGKVNQISKGEDYTVETDAMIPKIKTAARRRYKNVKVSRLDAEGNKLVDSLILQATPMNDEERAAEDLKRAEEKARRQADDGDDGETPAN